LTYFSTNTSDNYPVPSAGQIIFGSTNTPKCDPNFAYVPLTSKSYWQFSLDNFWIGTSGHTKPQQAISDTGTSFLGGPLIQIGMIVSATHAIMDFQNGIYVVDCEAKNLPDMIFTIGGQKYHVPAKEYVLDVGFERYLLPIRPDPTNLPMDLQLKGPVQSDKSAP
jgi:hypothetical protein